MHKETHCECNLHVDVVPGKVTLHVSLPKGIKGLCASQQVSRYEFSVSSRTGPAIFHRTKVLTVLPRYVISNQSETPLDFAQVGSNAAWRLPSGDVRHPWHWSDVEVPTCCQADARGRRLLDFAFHSGMSWFHLQYTACSCRARCACVWRRMVGAGQALSRCW